MRGAEVIICGLVAAALAAGPAAAPPAGADPVLESVQVAAAPGGRPLPAGFLSFSFEYPALAQYTGRDAHAVNPVLVALLRALNPLGHAVLRVGGDSTDQTWWPVHAERRPPGADYGLTSGWLGAARALARETGERLLVGINLAADRPREAALEARALLRGIGRRYLAGFEIGNEPDLYTESSFAHESITPRSRGYGFPQLTREFTRWRHLLPAGVPVAGPALATLAWAPNLPGFLAAEPGLSELTLHRYPLHGCGTSVAQPGYPSIANLLSPAASVGLALTLAPYVSLAHAHGETFRLDELNSVSCFGRAGVSNTFASALWLLNALFALAENGVDAVNLHTLPGAPYQPFSFRHRGSGWRATVHPVFYGALAFTRAFPPGARALPVSSPDGPVSAWATRDRRGTLRVTLVNPTGAPVAVSLDLPRGGAAPLTAQVLSAPGVAATGGVSLGGQSFAAPTATGRLAGHPAEPRISSAGAGYHVRVAPYSAMLLTG